MSFNLDAAIRERQIMEDEFMFCVAGLQQEVYDDFPLPEEEKAAALLRMSLLRMNINFLDSCIISGLLDLSIDHFPFN